MKPMLLYPPQSRHRGHCFDKPLLTQYMAYSLLSLSSESSSSMQWACSILGSLLAASVFFLQTAAKCPFLKQKRHSYSLNLHRNKWCFPHTYGIRHHFDRIVVTYWSTCQLDGMVCPRTRPTSSLLHALGGAWHLRWQCRQLSPCQEPACKWW